MTYLRILDYSILSQPLLDLGCMRVCPVFIEFVFGHSFFSVGQNCPFYEALFLGWSFVRGEGGCAPGHFVSQLRVYV